MLAVMTRGETKTQVSGGFKQCYGSARTGQGERPGTVLKEKSKWQKIIETKVESRKE